MSLTTADVEKVALLARLQLTAEEVDDAHLEQLGQVLEYIDQLQESGYRRMWSRSRTR